MLALLCVLGMFAFPLGDNIKVSLQLFVVFLIALIAKSFIDAMAVTGCYLLLGLFLPIYAGFTVGVSPTFGYVIAFVIICPIIHFMNKIPKIHPLPRMAIACVTGLLVCYAIGTVFMMAYLSRWDLGKMLLITVVPYLPFDAVKIALAILTVIAMPEMVKGNEKDAKK
jgi:biotin transport system substrate-specific component